MPTKHKLKPQTIRDYVVYVTYPNNSKEYAYLCNIPNIEQGDVVCGDNGTRCQVVRTADCDPQATRYVSAAPSIEDVRRRARIIEIATRLRIIQRQQNELDLWQKLSSKNSEAKKLYLELKGLLYDRH